MTIHLGHTPVTLLPAHAAFLQKSATLILADIHLGKSATFRAHGIPIPEGDTQADLERISHLISETHATHLIIAGDLVHSRSGLTPFTLEIIHHWLTTIHIPITLTEGNHDRTARLATHTLPITTLPSILIDGIHITHDPTHLPPHHPGIAGHLHPGLRISESPRTSRTTHRTPAFLLRHTHHLILPAFSPFTGLEIIKPLPTDRFFIPLKTHVLPLPP